MIVIFALRYSLKFGLHPRNIISEETARAMHFRGEQYAVLFGGTEDPACCATISARGPADARMTRVEFFRDFKVTHVYYMTANLQKTGRADLLLTDYKSQPGHDGARFYDLFVADVYGDGDLPTLTFDEVGNGGESHAISVPVDGFFFGPFPDFEELASGRFLDRLPKITLPPKNLWTDYIHQAVRTPATPKRTPIGRFPW